VAVLSIVLALATLSTNSEEAIVKIPETKIYESTSETAPLVTSVNPGYKLRILESYEEWSSVELPTKQKGWVKNNTINPI
jgi:SH3-like domain-containing protein